jgi:ribosome-associated toxin RatA of RatAB toxin-antitoxin module
MLSNNVLDLDKGWSKVNSKEGVVCYERKLVETYYMEHLASAVICAQLDDVVEVLNNTLAYPDWMYGCVKATLLEDKKDCSKLIYYVQRSPVDRWDSEMILSARTLVDLNSGRMIITLNSVDESISEYFDIRSRGNRNSLTGFKGSWRLEAVNHRMTRVRFTVYANPGEQKGEYRVNKMMQKICFTSLQGLLLMAERKRVIKR